MLSCQQVLFLFDGVSGSAAVPQAGALMISFKGESEHWRKIGAAPTQHPLGREGGSHRVATETSRGTFTSMCVCKTEHAQICLSHQMLSCQQIHFLFDGVSGSAAVPQVRATDDPIQRRIRALAEDRCGTNTASLWEGGREPPRCYGDVPWHFHFNVCLQN